MKQAVLFVSSNSTWGGSEILWSGTAALLAEKGYAVKFAVRYNHPVVQRLQQKGAAYIDLSSIDQPTIAEKILRQVRLKGHPFFAALLKERPPVGNYIAGKQCGWRILHDGLPAAANTLCNHYTTGNGYAVDLY